MKRIYKLYLAVLLAAVLAGSGVAYAQIGGGVGWFNIIQDVMISGDLQVNDVATIKNDLIVDDDLTVTGSVANDLTIDDDFTVTDLATIADLAVTEQLTVTDNATVNGNLFLDDDLNLDEETRIVVTDGSTITPLGSNTPISSTAATGTSSITAGTEGDILILWNIGAQTITLTDTGTLKLAGNAALGALDSIVLLADGTNWVELARANN